MLSSAYIDGANAAYSFVGLVPDMEKSAGLNGFLKKLMIAGTVAAGGAKGAVLGGETLSKVMSQHAAEEMRALMAQKKAGGAFVDAADYVSRNMSKSRFERASPEDLARATLKAMDAAGTLPANTRKDEIVKAWMAQAPYADYKSGVAGAFNPEVGAITGSQTHPSILAHELAGHGEQAYGKDLQRWYDDDQAINGTMGVIQGKQVNYEQDAWNKARQAGFKIDPEVENSSMQYYRNARAGLVGGGVAGAGAGAGATGIGLLGLASLLARKKRR